MAPQATPVNLKLEINTRSKLLLTWGRSPPAPPPQARRRQSPGEGISSARMRVPGALHGADADRPEPAQTLLFLGLLEA